MSFALLDDADSVAGNLVSVEVFTAIAQSLNTLMDQMPIGTMVPIWFGIPGVPAPDPNIWELCDGHSVANQQSPIRNQSTPDYTRGNVGPQGPFMKGAPSIGQAGNGNGSGNYGGNHYPPWLAHNHGGTQPYVAGTNDSDGNTWFTWIPEHSHGIDTDLVNPLLLPVNVTIKIYIKVI